MPTMCAIKSADVKLALTAIFSSVWSGSHLKISIRISFVARWSEETEILSGFLAAGK